jgi:arylsulfatase A
LRGYKSDVWEGGHRVPFIVRWPEVVTSNSVNSNLIHQADLLATFAEILDQEIPDNAGEDSFSFLGLLKGEQKPVRQHAVSCSSKLETHPGARLWRLGKGSENELIQLYDLNDDIGETRNLAHLHPERVTKMKAVLDSYIQSGRSTPGPPQNNDVEVVRYPQE